MQIYVQHNGQQLGPFTEAEFKAKLASGEISMQDHVWYQGMATWVPVAQSPLAASLPPAAPGAIPPPSSLSAAAPMLTPQDDKTSGLAIASLVSGCLTLFCGLLAVI